ncbi:dioxygenase family protein [Rhizobium leguminosarum]
MKAQEPLEATPTCGEAPTPKQPSGPYYSPKSPLKKDFTPDAPGQSIALIGRVVDTNCRPLSNVIIDMWQADARGEYDNVGFKMRGHQVTKTGGLYQFDTIMPGRYPGRTPAFSRHAVSRRPPASCHSVVFSKRSRKHKGSAVRQ